VTVIRFLLFLLALWLLWGNVKDPPEPEPFTWTGLLVKTLLILVSYVLISAITLFLDA
jgi:hypothetical protein